MTEVEFRKELESRVDSNLEYGFMAGTMLPYQGRGFTSSWLVDGFIVWKKKNDKVVEKTMQTTDLEEIIKFLNEGD